MLSVAFAAVRLGVLEILRIFSRTPNLDISQRFARATGVELGEREARTAKQPQGPARGGKEDAVFMSCTGCFQKNL